MDKLQTLDLPDDVTDVNTAVRCLLLRAQIYWSSLVLKVEDGAFWSVAARLKQFTNPAPFGCLWSLLSGTISILYTCIYIYMHFALGADTFFFFFLKLYQNIL